MDWMDWMQREETGVEIQKQTVVPDGTETLEQCKAQSVEHWEGPVLEWLVVKVEEEEYCTVVFQRQIACAFSLPELLGCI